MERIDVSDKRSLISAVKDNLLTEKFTDCVLVTKEGITVQVHSLVLTTSPTLNTLLLASSCCRGLCSHPSNTTIMLPDVSYRQLDIILNLFYTGELKCTKEEVGVIKELLVDVLGMSKHLVMLQSKPDHTDCEECGEHVPLSGLVDHMYSVHIEEPCVRDMTKVDKKDNSRVVCSQHSGPGNKPCDVDDVKTRISNGIFNYVGQEDPVSCVLEHYRIHFENFMLYLKRKHPSLISPALEIIFDDAKMRQLAKTAPSNVMESTVDSPLWTTRADVDSLLQSNSQANKNSASSTTSTSATGGLSSSEDEDIIKPARKNTKRKKFALDSSSDGSTTAIEPRNFGVFASSSQDKSGGILGENDISPPSYCNDFMISDVRSDFVAENLSVDSRKRKFHEESLTANAADNPQAKKHRDGGHKRCRVCRENIEEVHFTRHVTPHLYHLWPPGEVERDVPDQLCKLDCGRQFKNWKHHILHLATHHDQLNAKLAAADESLSDYVLEEDDFSAGVGVGDGEVGGLATLTACSRREVLARHDLDPDLFNEDRASPDATAVENETANNSEEPNIDELLDDSQEDPDRENASEPVEVDTKPTLPLVQSLQTTLNSPILIESHDSDSDQTEPWQENDDARMKEVDDC